MRYWKCFICGRRKGCKATLKKEFNRNRNCPAWYFGIIVDKIVYGMGKRYGNSK